MKWLSLTCLAVLVTAGAGCSSLGFSTIPVAHLMTRQTKNVLDDSPRCPQVPRELNREVMPAHYVQPGDELLIEPEDLDSEIRIPADQQVLADGAVDLGEYGRVVIAGLTLEQAEALIQEAIVEQGAEQAEINVRLIEPVHRFYVVGEVNSPGAYPLTGYETVLDGIMAAGGLTSRASACDMLLARPTNPPSCRVTLPVCYRAITQLGDTTTNYQLRPGDRIFVARQSTFEELHFWRGSTTCPRCCDRQRACRDPSIATYQGAEFFRVANQKIAPPGVTRGEAAGAGTDGDSPPASPVPGARPEGLPEPQDAGPGDNGAPPADQAPTPGQLDGELDFGFGAAPETIRLQSNGRRSTVPAA